MAEDGAQRLFSLKVADEHGAPVKVGMEQITINRLINGVFYSLNSPLETLATGEYELSLAAEELYLNYGYRVSDSQTAAIVRKITPDMDELELTAYSYPRSWQPAPKELLALFDEEILEEQQPHPAGQSRSGKQPQNTQKDRGCRAGLYLLRCILCKWRCRYELSLSL